MRRATTQGWPIASPDDAGKQPRIPPRQVKEFDLFYKRIRHHRDWETDPDIGNFRPEFWLDKPVDYRFNHPQRKSGVRREKSSALRRESSHSQPPCARALPLAQAQVELGKATAISI